MAEPSPRALPGVPANTVWLVTLLPFSLARLRYDRYADAVTYEARAFWRSNLPLPTRERFSPYRTGLQR